MSSALLKVIVLAGLGVLVGACATQPTKGRLDYRKLPEGQPVLQLSYQDGMIKSPDPTPFLRVFADGRVLVHYPPYMKKAGDYELRLSEAELDDLMNSFANEQLLTLETKELATKTAEMRAEAKPLAVPLDTHGLTTVVGIRAESFTPMGRETPSLLAVDHQIAVQDLPREAAALPKFQELQTLAIGVKNLEALSQRADLKRVEK